MSRPLAQGTVPPVVVLPGAPRRQYFVMRRQDLWFIAFEGEEFGPYKTQREAILFAVDAAHKFGEQGEETQVLSLDDEGSPSPLWTYGIDHYPPPPE
jgi:hypothetical protein